MSVALKVRSARKDFNESSNGPFPPLSGAADRFRACNGDAGCQSLLIGIGKQNGAKARRRATEAGKAGQLRRRALVEDREGAVGGSEIKSDVSCQIVSQSNLRCAPRDAPD